MLYEPTAVFERLRERPRILVPFIVLCVLSIILSVVTAPVGQATAALFQPPGADAGASAPPGPVATLIRAVIGAPIAVGIGLVASGFVLWLTTSLFGQDAQFKTLVSVAAHTFVTGMLYQATASAVLMMRGLENITGRGAPGGLRGSEERRRRLEYPERRVRDAVQARQVEWLELKVPAR